MALAAIHPGEHLAEEQCRVLLALAPVEPALQDRRDQSAQGRQDRAQHHRPHRALVGEKIERIRRRNASIPLWG